MGLADRDYYRRPPPSGPFGGGGGVGGARLWSVTTWLIVINIAVFVIDEVLRANLGRHAGARLAMGPLSAWGYFSASLAVFHFQVWRFITFQFLHAGIWHIVFNMWALYLFGRFVEGYLGSKRFLAFYLLCGVAGAVSYLLLWGAGVLVTSPGMPMVGASAGIFGVLIAAAQVAPHARFMLLFPPIPMQLRTLAWGLVGIGVFVVLTNGDNAGGQAAHLGGAALGFLLIRRPGLLNFAAWLSLPKFKPSLAARRSAPPADDAQIDRILAKVKDHGLHSLSEKEKRILQRATDERRQAS